MKKFLTVLGLTVVLSTSALLAETAGTVNGMKISVVEANEALKILTKGQKTWESLPAEGKTELIKMMAPAKLVAAASKDGLTEQEKEAALAGFWMQKSMAATEVTDKEAQASYDKMVAAAKKAKNKQQIPAFEAVKNNIKMQMAQEKVVAKLMKSAKIEVK